MKTTLLAVALLALSTAAVAAGRDRPSSSIEMFDIAHVESVSPSVERERVPGRCHFVTDTRSAYVEPSSGTGGAIVGGVIGGLLGSQVGGGSGKTAATAAGAIAGAIMGGNAERQDSGRAERTREVCEQDRWRETVVGYQVGYVYRGQRASVMLPYDPGTTLEVRVQVDPVGR